MKTLYFVRQSSCQGFTLIELLVVIAIISILAAILFPVFGRARENARRSSCQSNLKQISLGITQYKQDYDERFPLEGAAPVATPEGFSGWAYTLQPYLKSEQIFACPSETNPPPKGDTLQARAVQPGFTDYYLNFNLGDGPSDAQIEYPANVVTNGDGTGLPAGASNYTVGKMDALAIGDGASRHLEGSNFAFADGHVKWLRPERVLAGQPANLCGPGGANTPGAGNSTFCIY